LGSAFAEATADVASLQIERHFVEVEMKVLFAVLILALLMGCKPDDADIRPTPPVPEGTQSTDATLPLDVVASWGRQKEFFLKGSFQILDWEAAKALLLQKNYRGGKQYHTGWLTIYMHDGKKYLTKQPKMDIFFQFMKDNNLSTQGFGTE